MLHRYAWIVTLGLFLLHAVPVSGQHFTNCISSASNATLLISSDVSVDLGDETSLSPGDEIALFTSDGICAGARSWSGDHLAIAIAGTGSQETEGYEPDEPLQLKVWNASADTTYVVDATYETCESDGSLCRDDGRYETDAFYVVAGLTAREATNDESDGKADLSLGAAVDSVRVAVDDEVTFRFILANQGADDADDIEVAASVPTDLMLVSATASRGSFHTSTQTWTLDRLAANATDTLTITASAVQQGTYTLSAEVSASARSDPDSTPNNNSAEEDDQQSVVVTVDGPAECVASTLKHEERNRPPSEAGAILITIANPNGLLGVNFVDANGRPALQNFSATTSHAAFTSPDGIRWQHTGSTSAPTEVEFTLTQDDPNTPDARYEVEALSVCPDPNPRVTRFDPSSTFVFEDAPLHVILEGNAPNPFREQTTFHFTISAAAEVRLEIYDVLGRKIVTLIDGFLSSGSHAISWNGRTDHGQTVASGMYLYRLQVEDEVQTGRMHAIR